MLKGNRGEWSEIYVLLRILADEKIYAADEELNMIEDIYFPVLKVIREEIKGEIKEYKTGEIIELYVNGKRVKGIPKLEFNDEANILLKAINDKNSKGSFPILETQEFMDKIQCYKLSAPPSDKSDITLEIIDINTGYSPTVGFSIKSELGNPPTLLNAGKTTNFIFKVLNQTEDLIVETNDLYVIKGKKKSKDIRGRISNIIKHNGIIEYYGMNNRTFNDNLILIDSSMDKIIAETLLYFYKDGIIYCEDMVKRLEAENPMGYGNVNAYRYKFKKFLTAVALGMKPATVWDGTDEASGGYIIVTKEGSVLAYHIYNRNYFEEYLLRNTKYETASSTRHEFGTLYEDNYETYIKLNLQVRFI